MPLIKSKFPGLPALPPMNVHTFMFESAPGNQVPDDHVLYVDGITGETRTRGQFIERVRDAATALAAHVADGGLGLSFGATGAPTIFASQPKELVAIFSPNCLVSSRLYSLDISSACLVHKLLLIVSYMFLRITLSLYMRVLFLRCRFHCYHPNQQLPSSSTSLRNQKRPVSSFTRVYSSKPTKRLRK